MKKRIINVLFIVAFAIILSVSSFVIDCKPSAKHYTIDEPYQFPIELGTDEWNSYSSTDAKVEVCQVPEDILTNMTTHALLQTVLDYPLIATMLASSNSAYGYTSVRKSFNGLNELATREDALQEVKQMKIALNVPEDFKRADIRGKCLINLEKHIAKHTGDLFFDPENPLSKQ